MQQGHKTTFWKKILSNVKHATFKGVGSWFHARGVSTRNALLVNLPSRDWNPGFEKPGPRGNPTILPNPKPGFKSSWNPDFGFVFFSCLKLLSVHFYSKSCNSLMRFSLVIVHKLSRCLFLLFLWQTDCVLFMVTAVTESHGSWLQCTDVNDPWGLSWCSSVLSSVSWLLDNCSLLLQFSWWHTV